MNIKKTVENIACIFISTSNEPNGYTVGKKTEDGTGFYVQDKKGNEYKITVEPVKIIEKVKDDRFMTIEKSEPSIKKTNRKDRGMDR